MQESLEGVIEKLNTLLAGDGSRVTLLSATADDVTVRFERGVAGDCEACAIDPDAVEMLLREAITNQTRTTKSVHIVTAKEEET